MPFLISWDDETKITIRVSVVGTWSVEEFRKMLNDLVSYFLSVSHPVYIIAEALQSDTPPLGIVWHARYAFQRFPGNYSGGVVVTVDNYMKNVVATVRSLYVRQQGRLAAVRTLEEARRQIQSWKSESNP
jgi:hypothetical protein